MCPSHLDRNPSWSCNIRKGTHHCFSCGFSGNIAHLVAFMTGKTYSDAVVFCNQKIGWSRAHKWREDYSSKNFAPQYLKVAEADMAFFTEPGDEALRSKNISLDSAKAMDIRWNSSEDQWIFPIRDPYNYDLWGWQFKNGRVFRTYPAGIEKSKTLFGLSAFADGSAAVLVESPVDTARLLTAGIGNGLSSLGVSVSDTQLAIILQRAGHIVLALDNDNAGVSETARILRIPEFLPVSRIFNYGVSKAKDPGEMTDSEIREGIRTSLHPLAWLKSKRLDYKPSKNLFRTP